MDVIGEAGDVIGEFVGEVVSEVASGVGRRIRSGVIRIFGRRTQDSPKMQGRPLNAGRRRDSGGHRGRHRRPDS